MSWNVAGRTIKHVGVVGSGQIGPDIALHFAKLLASRGGTVAVVDISEAALEAGQAKMLKKIARGEKSGAFKPAHAQAMRDAVVFTTDYDALSGANVVVEAASEDVGLKGKIFQLIADRVDETCVLLSNSSHLEPERIFAGVPGQGRTAVAHYFFPAERNPVVELVPSEATSPETLEWLSSFYEALGKVPIVVGSRYGYACDPVFEGVFAVAALAVEAGLGSVKEVDYVAREALGMTVGPFTAMNLTGGNPITAHGLEEMHLRIQPWYRAPKLLTDKLTAEGPTGAWDVCGRGEQADVTDPARKRAIIETLQGGYLGLAFEIVDAGLVSIGDLELALRVALDMRGPCALANELGLETALALVERYAANHSGFAVPEVLKAQTLAGQPFRPSNLVEEDLLLDNGGVVRLIRVRRPKVLNALNAATYQELQGAFDDIAMAPHVVGAVLSGFGTKAFISGADVNALHGIANPEDGYAIAKLAQDVARQIETLGKPVVAAINGVTFGGGLELALGCTARVGVMGKGPLVGLPEVQLGIIPAGGGTQRFTRLVGWERAHALIRTGRALSAVEALAHGVISHISAPDRVVSTSVAMVAHIAAGRMKIPHWSEAPVLESAPELPDVELGHLSRAVDTLISDAIAQGLTMTLEQGLEHELQVFKRICELEDMRIGVNNFIANGPRKKAEFVHR